MKLILNVQDSIIGSWHQIHEDDGRFYVDGSLLPPKFDTHRALKQFLAAWEDDFEGIDIGKDIYLLDCEIKENMDGS